MTALRGLAGLLLVCVAWVLTTGVAHAEPRFAARTGADCQLCHVNPSGAGMRNDYGRNVYAANVLPLTTKAGEIAPTIDLSWEPMEGVGVSAGADMRIAFLQVDTEYVIDPATNEVFRLPTILSFFLMQDDLYAAVELGEKWSFYLDYGVASGSMESFALYRPGVADSYVKAGLFMPPYGLRVPMHRTYIREEALGLEPNLRDAGIELGAFPGPLEISVALINGLGGGEGFNPDSKFAVTGRADVSGGGQKLRGTLGVSGWFEPGGEVDLDDNDLRTYDIRAGFYAMASTGRFTYLTEWDWRRTTDRAAGTQVDMFVGYNELDVLIRQGLDLQLFFEYWDPDIALTPNVLMRPGLGLSAFLTPNTELQLFYRHTFADANCGEGGLFGDEACAQADVQTFFSGASAGMDEVAIMLHMFL